MKQEIGKALLVVFMEPEAGTEREFNAWYNQYHVPERVSVPGILSARRYELCDGEGALKYLAIYELEDDAVLQSEAYLENAAESTPSRIGLGPYGPAWRCGGRCPPGGAGATWLRRSPL